MESKPLLNAIFIAQLIVYTTSEENLLLSKINSLQQNSTANVVENKNPDCEFEIGRKSGRYRWKPSKKQKRIGRMCSTGFFIGHFIPSLFYGSNQGASDIEDETTDSSAVDNDNDISNEGNGAVDDESAVPEETTVFNGNTIEGTNGTVDDKSINAPDKSDDKSNVPDKSAISIDGFGDADIENSDNKDKDEQENENDNDDDGIDKVEGSTEQTLKPVGCGISDPQHIPLPKNRTSNKGETAPQSWPWQIRVRVVPYPKWLINCGGVLIRVKENVEKSDVILTAAHCVKRKILNTLYEVIYVSADAQNGTAYHPDHQTRVSHKTIAHPLFNNSTYEHDIAIVFLTKPFTFTSLIRPICLSMFGEHKPIGKECVITGWGPRESAFWSIAPKRPQHAVVAVHSDIECKGYWETLYHEETMLCAGGNKTDACKGESGGPLQCKEIGSTWTLYGIASFGSQCVNNRKGVYTRVSEYIPWIYEQIEEFSNV